MPKVRELGITVVPEGFGPMEVGAGGCGWSVCSDCTMQPFSICGGTNQPCLARTLQPCGQWSGCSDCTMQPFSICGGTQQCVRATLQCAGGTLQCAGGTLQCGISRQPIDPGLTKAQIDQLKATLKQQLEALEQQEKAHLPQTLEAIEVREKEIAAELEQLKAHKADLKKK